MYTRSPKAMFVEQQYQRLLPDLEKMIAIFDNLQQINLDTEQYYDDNEGKLFPFLETTIKKIKLFADLVIEKDTEGYDQCTGPLSMFDNFTKEGFSDYNTQRQFTNLYHDIYGISILLDKAAANKATEYDLEFNKQLERQKLELAAEFNKNSNSTPKQTNDTPQPNRTINNRSLFSRT
ncbi:MAG: hypothetical protein ACD_46C00570G0001 [uncultured bacterium]|nr:MAG: hypothetical protein ACD_46C00570G0001 [uncultured bacterium]